MSKKGQNNITGIEAQQWAALSLFLQYLSDPHFDHIQLEPPHFHDFNLVFKDGKKIICESKYHQIGFKHSDLNKILKATNKKHDVKGQDTILIFCLKVSRALESDVKMTRYFPEQYEKKFRKKEFRDKDIALISHVRFWKATSELNKIIVSALLADYLDYWIPAEDLTRLVNTIKQQFYDAASKGKTFSRLELASKVAVWKDEIVKKTGHYDTEKRKTERIVKELIKALRSNANPVWAEYNIAALSTQPHLLHFVFQRLQKVTKINLRKWDRLWKLNRIYGFSFNVFRIFSNNLNSIENRRYVLEYIKNNVESLRGFYRLDFFIIGAVDLIKKIIFKDTSIVKEAFQSIKNLLADVTEEILYVKNNADRNYQKEQIASVLKDIYDKADSTTQNDIVDYVSNTFDLINIDRKTPGAIYSILYMNLTKDWKKFSTRFDELTKLLIKQYGNFFKGKLHNGWDHIGSTGSFMGRNYHVNDRKIVEAILKPALNQFYQKKPQAAWQYIKEYCITSQKRISPTRPDFLNRSAIPVILEQFKSKNKKVAKKAFEILKEFILSSNGIPVKFELIYQTIRGDDFTDDQKWQLVKVSLDKCNIPITPFVEQIVTGLANKGHVEARETLKGWFENPKYFGAAKMVDYAIPNIEAFIEADLPFALTLFEKFISNPKFIHGEDEFEAYDASVVLQTFLERNYTKGLGILKKLLNIDKPSINQQILISHGFFRHRDPNDKSDPKILSQIYKEYVKPQLNKFRNSKYLTHSHSRTSFLQFARKLALNGLIKEALEIVNMFINDPNPYLPGEDPEDPENIYNEQKQIEDGKEPSTITSVRGWCAWTLASCPAIPSRKFIPKIQKLTEQLLKDPNWYVKHMACFSLKQLVRNRLSVMPPEKKILYLDLYNDKSDALKRAKDFETLAFKLLEEVSNSTENIQKALTSSVLPSFDHIRALSQKDAERFLKIIQGAAVPLKAQSAPFLIYLAEFRNTNTAYKEWPWRVPGYYDDLGDFDDTCFKGVLEEWVTRGPKEVRTRLSWELRALIQEAYEEKFEMHFPIALKYLELASHDYEHRVFENIYSFIDDCIDIYFEECFSLWKKCLKTEKSFFDKMFNSYEMYWWPYHYNGRILLKVKKQHGDEALLKWLEILSSYPKGSRLEDLRPAVELLVDMPSKYTKQVKMIFDHLINARKELSYCDLKEAWERKKRDKKR